MLFSNITDKNVLKRLLQVHYQSLNLRKLLSYSVRISDFNHCDLELMKRSAYLLFKTCCLFDQKVTPSLWTLCNIAPVNAEQCLRSYGFGLGCNTMEGREQKHQKISKYAENTPVQNRWPMIFRHESIQLIHLRENGYDSVKYIKKSSKYIPVPENNLCEQCFLEFQQRSTQCALCNSDLRKEILRLVEN